MKKSNIWLLAILAILISLFYISKYFKENNTSTHFDVDIINIDSASVNLVTVYPAGQPEDKPPVTLTKNNNLWEVSEGEKKSTTSKSEIDNLLSTLANLKIERLVTKKKEKWAEYKVNDSLATEVEVKQVSGDNLNFYIGKIKNAQGRPVPSTYVRFKDNDNVYLVDGFISTIFNKEFKAWRNSLLSQFNKDDITQLNFEYSDNITDSFKMIKQDSVWDVSGNTMNESKVNDFLSKLSNKTFTNFKDDFQYSENTDFKLVIAGDNMEEFTISGYNGSDNNQYILNSSLNAETFFAVDSTQRQEIFIKRGFFN